MPADCGKSEYFLSIFRRPVNQDLSCGPWERIPFHLVNQANKLEMVIKPGTKEAFFTESAGNSIYSNH